MPKKFIPTWFGEVKDRKLSLYEQDKFKSYISSLDGKSVVLQVKKLYKSRSLDANAYLWVIYTIIAEHTGYTPEEIHEICKSMFLKKTKKVLDRYYEVIGSTSGLDSFDFSEYVEKVKRWAITELKLIIPEADKNR